MAPQTTARGSRACWQAWSSGAMQPVFDRYCPEARSEVDRPGPFVSAMGSGAAERRSRACRSTGPAGGTSSSSAQDRARRHARPRHRRASDVVYLDAPPTVDRRRCRRSRRSGVTSWNAERVDRRRPGWPHTGAEPGGREPGAPAVTRACGLGRPWRPAEGDDGGDGRAKASGRTTRHITRSTHFMTTSCWVARAASASP
jgi:hypothetical protein